MITTSSVLRSRTLLLALIISAFMAFGGGALFYAVFFGTCSKGYEPVEYVQTEPMSNCDFTLQRSIENGATEVGWLQTIGCFEQAADSEGVIRSAGEALKYFPKSETIINVKGYHEIELKRYREAVRTLTKGIYEVETPTSGTMENNLSWAGLWVSMDNNDLRKLYRNALKYDANDCEIVHTGMWVEYAIASETAGERRNEAISEYRELRRRYDGCENRNNSGEHFAYEVVGAGVLDHAMATIIATGQLERGHIDVRAFSRSGVQTVRVGLRHLPQSAFNSTDEICRNATPIARLRSKCRALVGSVR